MMSEGKYRYCKIFVKAAEVDDVMAMLAAGLGGQFDRHSMFRAGLVVEARRNSDAKGIVDPDDDFVRWQVLVELDAEDEVGELAMRDTTAKILNLMWDSGHPAVAACDFEDELPWNGGIQRLRG